MKTKGCLKIFLILMILIFTFNFNVFADTNISVYVDNEKIDFDVNPIIEDGRTLIPLRGVFEKLGARVDWNKNISEVVIKDKSNEIQMLLGKNKVMVNGEIKDIDVPTKMINSRTFAPLRFITENLGHTIKWDDSTNSIYIAKNNNNVPISQNRILTVGSKENLIALLEYNSKLYNYIWREGRAVSDNGVSMDKSEAETPATSPGYESDNSDTNNQVEGVQEGDIIKNDGKYIYVNTFSGLKIIDSNPANPQIVSTVAVPENTSISEMFISDKKLIIIGQNNMFHIMNDTMDSKIMIWPPRQYDDRTNVLIYDIENIEKPKLEKEYLFEGNYLSGRTIEDKLYLVSTKHINYYNYDIYSKDADIPTAYYTDVLTNTKYEFTYDEIKYFPNYIDSRYMYTIGIDLSADTQPDVDVYLGGSDTIYVSKDSMYAAIADYSYDYTAKQTEAFNPVYTSSTVVYKFNLYNGNIDVEAQGRVPGNIINQFSMDEYEGYFRIATTTGEMWQNTSENNVYVLNFHMQIAGRLEGLAQGERIYSTRFAGDRIYMVTFRQVDPLYVIDTSDPVKPAVVGELKIPGYSTYLHMVDENHILGFGYDTEVNQWGGMVNGGLKLTLFDVTKPNSPKEVYTDVIGSTGTYSELLYNHKALMFSLQKGLMAFPVNVMGDNYKTEFSGAYLYNVKNDGLSFNNKISHMGEDYSYGDEIKRIIYINDYLYTFSDNNIQVHSIKDNKKVSELSIRQ
ncbi:beta-propeller domain-containing protein [Sedimentibacter hydroxybenzoicus DSM 7310]|uniref:Beta-propeller domain-containing protein n=1 Tax=Sedimentibacter hydroxybenzoicus DSM 7310 TaxID=1123245 RepID=A0A974GWL0_SEDHY|nr:beta-propeller domain-containing protein [Sedimentibacter hydroxybenzoicus]NYB74617.1 beta-propeller domain-containing protein [Sedimentibacter hydroxybenzoicus DSM 7310]